MLYSILQTKNTNGYFRNTRQQYPEKNFRQYPTLKANQDNMDSYQRDVQPGQSAERSDFAVGGNIAKDNSKQINVFINKPDGDIHFCKSLIHTDY